MTALELIGITRTFGTFTALDDANLVIERGTVHGLLGENGAGKTTLMRIAYGLLRPDRGDIRIDGRSVHLASPAQAIAFGFGMVHQHPANVPAMTVAENLELGRRGPYRSAELRATAREHAARVGFSIDIDALVGTLSVAAQQRVEILKALARNARLLIFDEPTAVLAPSEARELYAWLRRYAATGGTAVIITHKVEDARSYTDDVTVLRRGRTVLRRHTSDAPADDIAQAMLGEAPPSSAHQRDHVLGASVVRATNVTINSSRGNPAIQGATLEARRGEVVGIVGVEGAGHHELLLALAGRLPASSGTLEVPDRIGFVPEDRHRDAVALDFSLTENVAIQGAGRRRGAMRWRELGTLTTGLIERFDVRARGANDSMAALSGGNQQKLVLARELDAEPDLLVLENPTRGLDIRAATFVRDRIVDARNRGTAVVLYSSDLDEVMDAADRVLVVHAGRVSSVGSDRSRIGAAMLGAP